VFWVLLMLGFACWLCSVPQAEGARVKSKVAFRLTANGLHSGWLLSSLFQNKNGLFKLGVMLLALA
jgi:hypothetical protein